MGPRLWVVEIALQAGESATSGFCGLSCERRPRRQGRAARYTNPVLSYRIKNTATVFR